MIGEPSQVEAGKYHANEVAVTIFELLGKVNHFLAVGRVDPLVSDGQSIVSHSSRKKRLIGDGGCGRSACTKDPTLCIGRPKQAVIRIARPQLRQQGRTGLRLTEFDGLQLANRQQQLSSTFAQLADFRGKLLNSINDAFSNYTTSLVAQVAFMPGLDCDHWEYGQGNQQQ